MNQILHHSVRLNCDPHKAFEMFTVNKLVEPWLVHPYGGSHTEIESKLSGKYEIFWDKNGRENKSTLGCKITAIETGKFLSFEWKGPTEFAQFMNTADPLTHVVVFLIPVGNRENPLTEVHLVHSGWGSSKEWDEAREWFRRSWSSAFEHLRKLVNESKLTVSA